MHWWGAWPVGISPLWEHCSSSQLSGCGPPSEQLLPGLASSVELDHLPLQGTQSGPGSGTLALRGGRVGLSATAATNPPPSLQDQLCEPGSSGSGGGTAQPAGIWRRWQGARRRSLGRGGDNDSPGSCPSAWGSQQEQPVIPISLAVLPLS